MFKFGEFILKFGCISFYFFNVGLFNIGCDFVCLGCFYVVVFEDVGIEYDVIFGFVYKGILIVMIIVVVLVDYYDKDVFYCFNCKEKKVYGEGGILVGFEFKGKIMLVDDVIIVGIVICELMEIIVDNGVDLSGVLIVFDC